MVVTEERQRISRLLIVDDDQSQLRTLTAVMEAEGFEVVGCSTASEALEHLVRGEIGVAVVDLRLPDLSGTQLLERLQSLAARVEVVIHTGYSSYESAKNALNLGAFGYVEKGADPDQLVHHVYRAFEARLQRHAGDLENAVAQRTRELEQAFEELKQEIAERKRAEKAIREAHDELETRVEQRTAELQAANVRLQEESTNRKLAEERERQLLADLTHMERLNTMGELASGIAHELNQPLAVIVMRAEAAAQKLRLGKEPSKEDLLESLTWIGDEGYRAGQIIRHMRRFVQHMEPRRTTVQVSEVVNEVVPLVESDLRHADIRFTVDVDPSLPLMLADKIQVQQVLEPDAKRH